MIYVTGDTHGDMGRFAPDSLIEKTLKRGDILIICGDFGHIWDDSEREQRFLDYLGERPYQILFIDGNHENYDLLESYPEEAYCGGKVHVIRRAEDSTPKLVHLMRGQVFEIENEGKVQSFFTFGGGYSFDRGLRVKGVDWWPGEMPTRKEMEEGMANLSKRGYVVDYVITHTGPEETIRGLIKPYSLENPERPLHVYLELLRDKGLAYQQWYFGHWHEDRVMFHGQTMVSLSLRNIETNEVIE